ncbi:Transcriptional regulator [Labilithrix luteola]|uniref:Transcriptional regulator n=1 Tax=Labilithrix luteola TaxID=1391654 RepID=A0A0K1Q1K1_9BACT|nr:LysR family transcriptional regulator [Labilithrix luteola]AKU99511.1 Transcriptional regulator [Labilithrix luteola]
MLQKRMAMPMDWDDVRFFLAVTRAGTLASAARSLGVDQTTVGRRLASLEESVGQTLLERAPTGFSPTEVGRRVIGAAETMADAAGDFEIAARSDEAGAVENVRVATTDSLAEHFVIPALATLRARKPNVNVDLQTAWARVNLLRGEADIAVRLVRPTHRRLVARKVADFAMRAYASPAYVAARGMPASDFRGHDVLAYTAAREASSNFTLAGLDARPGRNVLQTNSGSALLRAARDGLGVAELPSYVGDADPGLVRVCANHARFYSVYLVSHEDRRRVRAVRAVSEAIAAAFDGYRASARQAVRSKRSR